MSFKEITEQEQVKYTGYILEKIKYIIDEFSDRYPGSPAENKAHEYLKKELENYTDEIKDESFKVPPKAFMSFIPIAAILSLISFLFYWFIPLIAFLLTGSALLIVLFHFVMYKKILDPFFPKKISHNVLGVNKPSSGQTKQTMILSGHVDASFEWRYSKINPVLVRVVLIPAVLGIFIKLIMDLLCTTFNFSWQAGYNSIWGIFGLVQLALIPIMIAAFRFTNYSVVSPGASDNLSGTLMAVAIAKYLKENGIILKDTEVHFLLTGSEEAGLRGAKAYCKKHLNELKSKKAIFIGLESFCELEHLAINNKDLSGTVKNDPAVCLLLKNAGKNCGLDIRYQAVYIGATDAAAFSQAGIPASTIEAMDPGPPQWYHTRYDTYEHLEKHSKTMGIAFKIVVEALKIFDAEGLPEVE